MPEAAIHKDDRVPFWKHDVRMSGQFGGMKAIAEPQGVEVMAHKHLRFRVLRPNPAHCVTALPWGYFVHCARKANFICPPLGAELSTLHQYPMLGMP